MKLHECILIQSCASTEGEMRERGDREKESGKVVGFLEHTMKEKTVSAEVKKGLCNGIIILTFICASKVLL